MVESVEMQNAETEEQASEDTHISSGVDNIGHQNTEHITSTNDDEEYSKMPFSVSTTDEDIMPWQVWNDYDETFNASLEFTYEEKGQEEEWIDELDFLNIRSRTKKAC